MIRRIFIAFAAATLLGACATAETLAARPLDTGTSMEFAAPATRVADVTKQTLRALGLAIPSASQNGPSTVIGFEKGIGVFSWGEVGRIVVTPLGETASKVYIDTEKRSQMQITGTSESDFARDIFAGIKQRLAN